MTLAEMLLVNLPNSRDWYTLPVDHGRIYLDDINAGSIRRKFHPYLYGT